MTLSSSGYKRKEQPVRIRRGLQWQVDNKMGWHWSPSLGVLSTAFSWEFPCASFVGNLPSKNGSRPSGGLIKILLLCPKMYCTRQMVEPGQWVPRCGKGRGNTHQASEAAAADTGRNTVQWASWTETKSRGRRGGAGISAQSHLEWQAAWVQTEAIWHIMNISHPGWYPLYLQMNFTRELKRPQCRVQPHH